MKPSAADGLAGLVTADAPAADLVSAADMLDVFPEEPALTEDALGIGGLSAVVVLTAGRPAEARPAGPDE